MKAQLAILERIQSLDLFRFFDCFECLEIFGNFWEFSRQIVESSYGIPVNLDLLDEYEYRIIVCVEIGASDFFGNVN